ncbi:hypothetical protein [Pontibacter akesuensis]|uniref:Uncharacterized protein n=1 Tax=Pontibacter akesuensis TaxID=388950 RepID=A0A1I7JJB2_9BACT|nr:hypothetical protein [Pontibacter akesuensis]GHA69556.1 hypothetical protein GCM10007389_23340 [Pontibacter akesuensis]SFU85272.1 hypothetical protein SAMN04487941_2941 [Pontibacter akesuensis]
MKKIKSTLFTIAAATVAVFGMSACGDTSEPGDTSVQQGEFYEDQGGMVVEDGEEQERTRRGDTTQEAGERYYNDSDHDSHKANDGKALGDGAYDGKGNGVERDEIDGQ